MITFVTLEAQCRTSSLRYQRDESNPPDRSASSLYDKSRNPLTDAAFAQGTATGMVPYEREAFPHKKEIFSRLFYSLEEMEFGDGDGEEDSVVVEIGMGSCPKAMKYNTKYFRKGSLGDGRWLDIIGVDPNDRIESYARDSAERVGLLPTDSLRIIHDVLEALPLPISSIDAVVCTLTLCSVPNPTLSLQEIKRVLFDFDLVALGGEEAEECGVD